MPLRLGQRILIRQFVGDVIHPLHWCSISGHWMCATEHIVKCYMRRQASDRTTLYAENATSKWVYCYASNNVYTVGKCHSIHKQRMLASTSGVPMNQILQYSARLWIGLKDLDKVWCVLIVDWWVGICQVNMHSLWLYFYVACLTISDDICCRLDAMQTSGDIINNRRVRSVTWWCLLTCLICGWSRWWSTTRHREV